MRTAFLFLSVCLLAGCTTIQEDCERASWEPGFNFPSVHECVAYKMQRNGRLSAAFSGASQNLQQQRQQSQPMPTNQNCTVHEITPTQKQVSCY